jgi:ADP-ribose pyrophosphatase YjhB (NUDIX family)
MISNATELAWTKITELRKELVEHQKIRTQIIGFKITLISALVAFVSANFGKLPPLVFVVPGFAAIFFDLIVHSYSFSIKRTGFYCRHYLEPIVKSDFGLTSSKFLMWEEFMASTLAGKNVAFWANFGLTALAIGPSIVSLQDRSEWIYSIPLLALLFVLLAVDVYAMYAPGRFSRIHVDFKYYRNPKPCVAVFIVKGDEVLLAKRANDPAMGKWDIVGGFVDHGESSEDAIVREAIQETRCKIRILEYLGSIPDVYGDTEVATVNACFVAEIITGEPKARDDVALLDWFPIDRPPAEADMAFAHHTEALRRLREWHQNYSAASRTPPLVNRSWFAVGDADPAG